MKTRLSFLLPLALFGALTASATTTYSFGTNNNVSLGSQAYAAGVWAEVYSGGAGTTQQIDCVVALASTANVCGNPGPGSAQHISVPVAPGNTAILPTGTTNYFMADGDNTYGAPIWTNLTGLTANTSYQITFYQSSNQESGNNQADTDKWLVYTIAGGSTGVYGTASSAPAGATLAYTSATMSNPGGTATNWQQQTFTFTTGAGVTNEILEFVTSAVATGGGAVTPPMLNLAAVSLSPVQQGGASTPEPGTASLSILGGALVFIATKFRRRSSDKQPSTEA
jgi:hypothetical protein